VGVVIKIEWLEGTQIAPSDNPEGSYVEEFDPDAENGRGVLKGTRDKSKAKKFADAKEAMEFYRQQSTVRPLRPDGHPNRPLTAYSVSIEGVD
jgi:hypothetical protein